jgi:DNA repair exonuclease SbcCD ATPase subunit/UDP-2,3-diacylglucosamine pyrophosphatase LpxH
MINLLKTDVQKFSHVLQIADIHIRLNKRHDEYREVFNNLYEEVKKTPATTAIALVGDVFHSKSDLSPECIQLASDLFKALADLRPTILVAGNHDATLSNKSRLDSLTPLVDSLAHPNLYYLKTTGLYGIANLLFNNMGVFDAPERYIMGKDIPDVYRNQYEHIIALFHGAVDRAALDSGYSISNPAIMTPLFDHHDIAMLGDIHKMQDMQSYDPDAYKPCVHYVGSMIQQNHGETLHHHGYTIWDLKTRTYTFHELKNEYGYFTVEIHKGNLTTDLADLPKKVRLRVKCYETIASEVKKVIADIKSRVQVVETAYVRMDQERDKKDVIPLCKDIVLTDLTNVDYQNRLISEYLTKRVQLNDPQKLEDILAINRNVNALIKRDEFSRNLKWKPIRFEFDNMFTYGEGNVIDFTAMNGVYGIFGTNKLGKSSILSAIIFCLFDKFDRGFKGMHVLNVQKTSFRCKLEFEISGVRYFIEREGDTTRSGNVKVDVRFWKLVNGVEEELHGTARRDTNDIIRDYIGTYEDFILTAASFQSAKNLTSFIDMGNSERKDLLVQFIGLNIFDRLQESGNERAKELTAILKTHRDKNYQLEIQQNKSAFEHATAMVNELEKQVNSLQKQISDVNEQIVMETSNLIKLDTNIPTDLSALEERKAAAEEILATKRKYIADTKMSLAEAEKWLSDVNSEIDKIEKSNFVEAHKTWKKLADQINTVKQKIDLKKVEVKGKLDKVARLKTHKYNPDCEFCVDNSFVKDANQAKKELAEDKKETDAMLVELAKLQEEYTKYSWVEQSYENYTKLLNRRSDVKDTCTKSSKNIIVATNECERLDNAYKSILNQIELYNRNAAAVEANVKVQSKISAFRNTVSKLELEFQKSNKSLMDVSGKRGQFKAEIEKLTKILEDITEMEYELDSYQNYLQTVGRDGIPYQVICNTVPEIEQEVNAILTQVVDYTIQFETDGKNVIPYVVYEYGRWPIELTSGYERFVASVAIRVALTNISNLPKTTFLALDEGFGTLDPDNLASMFTLFSFLKNNFDFVLVISHLDALKDAVDKTIEIRREGNFSFVNYE